MWIFQALLNLITRKLAGRVVMAKILYALLLYDEHDLTTHMKFIKWNNPDAEYYQHVYNILEENMEKISAYGFDWLKKIIHHKNRHDFRLETVLNIF